MGTVLPGVLGRFPLGTRQGTSLRGAGESICIHSPAGVHVSGEISCLDVAGGRFWKAGGGGRGGVVQAQPGWTAGPVDLTYEAGLPGLGSLDPPIGPSPGTPALCSSPPTRDIVVCVFLKVYPV